MIKGCSELFRCYRFCVESYLLIVIATVPPYHCNAEDLRRLGQCWLLFLHTVRMLLTTSWCFNNPWHCLLVINDTQKTSPSEWAMNVVSHWSTFLVYFGFRSRRGARNLQFVGQFLLLYGRIDFKVGEQRKRLGFNIKAAPSRYFFMFSPKLTLLFYSLLWMKMRNAVNKP